MPELHPCTPCTGWRCGGCLPGLVEHLIAEPGALLHPCQSVLGHYPSPCVPEASHDLECLHLIATATELLYCVCVSFSVGGRRVQA